jgi:hypothetical protein
VRLLLVLQRGEAHLVGVVRGGAVILAERGSNDSKIAV